MKIQTMRQQDLHAVFALEQQAHLVPWSLGVLQQCQGENYHNLLLYKGNTLVGFVICQQVLDEACLFNIAISPPFQGQGLGKILLTHLMEKLRNQGVITLWLEVREHNEKAIKLYEKQGFKRIGMRKNYYPTPNGGRENAITMVRKCELLCPDF